MPTKTSPQERFIGKRVKELRPQLRLTQQHVAKTLGITGQQIQKYENALDHIFSIKFLDFEGIIFDLKILKRRTINKVLSRKMKFVFNTGYDFES